MLHTELIAAVPVLLKRHAEARAGKVAFRDKHRAVTYGELAQRTHNLAGHLVALGATPGTSVAIWMPNSVAWVEACFAIVRAGGVAVPISDEAALAEAQYRLADAQCRILITTEDHASAVEEIRADVPSLAELVIADRGAPGAEQRRFASFAEDATVPDPPDPLAIDDVAFIVYTSGTTGRAKGVMLTTRSILWVTAACWAPIAGLTDADYVLSPLPLYHSYALNLCVMSILATGATEYIMEKYSTTESLALLRSESPTVMPGVPTMFHYLLQTTRNGEALEAPSLRLFLSAGAIMPGWLNAEVESHFGVKLLDGYGITETSTMVTLNWPTGTRVMGSCGLPLPGLSVRIVDPATGNDVDAGQEGELITRGPNLMRGYLGKPQETAAAIRAGWYHTGDLATVDANGFITITGRLKELIIRGGQNIAPGEIEEAAASYPAVFDCAAVGLKHTELGEVPVLFVVPREDGDVDAAALLAHCRERLSPYKVPHAVHVIERIPRTGSGKIIRFALRERL